MSQVPTKVPIVWRKKKKQKTKETSNVAAAERHSPMRALVSGCGNAEATGWPGTGPFPFCKEMSCPIWGAARNNISRPSPAVSGLERKYGENAEMGRVAGNSPQQAC